MMKWIAIFFLLANVIYFGWQMNQRLDHVIPATANNEEVVPASSKPLVLLSELEELPPLRDTQDLLEDGDMSEAVSEETVINEGDIDMEGTCFSIGPYVQKADHKTLSDWLLARNIPFRERPESIRTRERYWVYLEPQDEAEAKAQLDELKNKGLSDYYMISKGDMKNAISLGLFSSQDAVNRRLVELEREGYNPVVVPQHKISTVLWLDAQLSGGLALPDLPEGIEITNLDCLEIALLSSDQ